MSFLHKDLYGIEDDGTGDAPGGECRQQARRV